MPKYALAYFALQTMPTTTTPTITTTSTATTTPTNTSTYTISKSAGAREREVGGNECCRQPFARAFFLIFFINFSLSSCSVNSSSYIVGAAFRRPRDGKPVPYNSINRNFMRIRAKTPAFFQIALHLKGSSVKTTRFSSGMSQVTFRRMISPPCVQVLIRGASAFFCMLTFSSKTLSA